MRYLNLGCGNCYHHDWINIDFRSNNPLIISYDLRKGIPLPENSCDVVYHSHVIEHFRREEALPFMEECLRVLKPNGILRVVTPNLEQICRIYLEIFDSLKNGNTSRDLDYEWILLEMYDQTVREKSGGQMITYLLQNTIPNEKFVLGRIGEEGRQILRSFKERTENGSKLHNYQINWHKLIQQIYNCFTKFRCEVLLPLLVGPQGLKAIKIGYFRQCGEVHQWMYDSYSLSKLIRRAGFINPIEKTAFTSQIPKWTYFNLDTLPDGSERKPDSLYFEALKPIRERDRD